MEQSHLANPAELENKVNLGAVMSGDLDIGVRICVLRPTGVIQQCTG